MYDWRWADGMDLAVGSQVQPGQEAGDVVVGMQISVSSWLVSSCTKL